MQEWDDMVLLQEYVKNGSEAAFAVLVTRHVNKVYSVALRHTRNPHQAEEITQAVFVILAHKAKRLGRNVVLSGWLYQTARFTAVTVIRGEIRRARREQEAHMQTLLNETDSTWPQIAPLLDNAMAGLNKADRDAVVLRYFDGKTMKEVGTAMGASEDAAKMRLSRAVEKLRRFFTRRGVVVPAAALMAAIAANSVAAAPATLANTATAAAITKGAAASLSTLAMVKGALKAMTWIKVKLACGAGLAVLFAGGAITLAVATRPNDSARYQIEGQIVYHVPARDAITTNFPAVDMTRDFTLTVNGRNWTVHITAPQMVAHGIKFQEVAGLRGSLYRYDYYGPPAKGAAINSGGATIRQSDFPNEDGTFANIVWYGLASADYLAHVTDVMAPSLWNYPVDPAKRVKADWQLSDTAPFLPKSIDFHHDSDAPFGRGWIDAQLRWVEETNIDGMIFPLTYTCEQFRPKQNGVLTTNDVLQAALFTVNLRSIRLHYVPDVRPPKTQGVTFITDSRAASLIKNGNPYYFSKAASLPEKPDLKAIEEYQNTISPSKSRRPHPAAPRTHEWMWISTAVGALVIIVSVQQIRKRSQ